MSTKQDDITKLKIPVDPRLTKEERSEVAMEVINHIFNTADSGKKPTGGKFPQYTKEYAKFKGVSRGAVDLQLSHKMLNSLNQLKSAKYDKKGMITVGYKRGTKQERKAEGNILGSYGDAPNPKKARPFLGIQQSVLDEITKTILSEREEEEAIVEKTDRPSLILRR
jgi:hypothetical protein